MNLRNPHEVNKAFQTIFPDITGAQIWAIVKMMKHARLRCRNNAALNNWMNSAFAGKFTFRQVNKQRPKRGGMPGEMETYPGLQICDAKTGQPVGSEVDSQEGEE